MPKPTTVLNSKTRKDIRQPQCHIKITSRDVEILNFINEFGFCEMPQIDKRFTLKNPRNYQIVRRFIKLGLVKHERIFYRKHGIYRLTRKGAQYTELPPLAKIALANYRHDIMLIEVYLKLRKLYPDAQWLSERKLKRDKYFDGVGKFGHLPDGILVFPDGKQSAIELELNLKGRNRIERILKWYSGQLSIQEVWYYCPAPSVATMSLNAARMPFVKIYNLQKLLE